MSLLALLAAGSLVASGAPATPASTHAPSAAPARVAAGPSIGGCPIFPATDPWNRDVSHDPVDPRSAAYLAAEAKGASVHLDLGTRASEGYGIPFVTVPKSQKRVPLKFGVDGADYGDESDHGPMPIPATAPIEGGTPSKPDPAEGDRHVLVLQRGTCLLYELYQAVRVRSGSRVVAWKASSAARFDLRHGTTRPATWTSADAAGLPILPGLLRYPEAKAGAIRHALRVTLPVARKAFVAPARHCGPSPNRDALPYGARLRLKASFSESRYSGTARTVVHVLKTYGLIFADQGSPLYVSGVTDPGWAAALDQIHGRTPIPWDAFEVLRLGAATNC